MRKEKMKKRIHVIEREVAEDVIMKEYKCPPHVVHYVDMIMHWRCEFCSNLWHKKPKNSYEKHEVAISVVKKRIKNQT